MLKLFLILIIYYCSMKIKYLNFLKCVDCGGNLILKNRFNQDNKEILNGTVVCEVCDKEFLIINGIPRFVSKQHYSSSFGFEWNKHSFTQYDSHSGQNISKKRLDKETNWSEGMKEELILEAGCGSGRFTEHLLKTSATVFSVDASIAVDENFKHHRAKENSFIAQADITSLPFKKGSFDKVLCIGVLQHTKNPFETFKFLVFMLKSGGCIVADVYDKQPLYKRIFNTRYWIRPVTKRLPNTILYKFVKIYINLMWPFVKLIHKLPYGVKINHKLLIAEHLSYKKLDSKMHKEWAILDTFDRLSPMYEFPQTIKMIKKWCKKLPLKDVEVQYGYGGIEIKATRI